VKTSRTRHRGRHGSKEFDTESISSEGTASIHSTKKHKIKVVNVRLNPKVFS